MGEPAARRKPWGLVLTVALLALLLVLILRAAPGLDRPAPWGVVLSAGATAAGAFLLLRRLQSYFWGMAGALALALHPLRWDWFVPFEQALRAEGMELVVLAVVAAGWDLVALPRFAWAGWLAVAVAVVGAGALAWPALPQSGLVTSLLTVLGLLLGVLLTSLRHRVRPSWANRMAAVLLALGGPPVALLLGAVSLRAFAWPVSPGLDLTSGPFDLLTAALRSDAAGLHIGSYAAEQLRLWAWPATWLVLPLTAVGLWCAARRGLREFTARRPPLPWLLGLYALLELTGLLLHPRDRLGTTVLPLAAVALLLAVFGAAEVMRALTKPLILPPPGERVGEDGV
jgi:hypothetical protein